ncbi:ATP-dependent nuclease [Lactobacillus helveticus]|uniref:AAA family ATPase n=1 Tax=Lactobacillus helveticus TaxID=1587 RepID=A0A6A7K3E7_LACHE|nr:AAA family ATPase [Lactobacillus helveticus]MPW15137.1 AAA family ATPase [Lactobacillus helveticus]
MVWIKELHIIGFKGIENHFDISFSKNKNLIIGINVIGKSTILQAIDLVMQKKGVATFGNGILGYANYVNKTLVEKIKNKFLIEGKDNLGYDELPKIIIAAVLETDNEKDDKLEIFSGINFPKELNWSDTQEKIGLYFEYKFDSDFRDEFEEYLSNYKENETEFDIPFEFYSAEWQTFGGRSYSATKDPMNTILIDNDSFEGNPFNAFSKRLYSSMPLVVQIDSRINFRKYSKKVKLGKKESNKDYRLLIDSNSVNLENIIDVLDQKKGIFVRDLGSGEENLIKTKMSLRSNSKLILIEEPENHLTAENSRKQISLIESNFNEDKSHVKQIILTTHNPEVLTRLDLQNCIWLKNDKNILKAIKINKLDKDTIDFFNRRDDLDFLRILTAKRVIVVEGATEFILMRTLLRSCGYSDDKVNSVEMISMVGRTYNPFFNLGDLSDNKILIFTDNDYLADEEKDPKTDIFNKRIDKINEKNKKSSNVKIFCSQAKKDQWKREWTIEAAIYYKNKKEIESNPDFKKGKIGTHYKKQLENIGSPKKLAYMLNNKKKVVFLEEQFRKGKLQVPGYIRKGFKWLFTNEKS